MATSDNSANIRAADSAKPVPVFTTSTALAATPPVAGEAFEVGFGADGDAIVVAAATAAQVGQSIDLVFVDSDVAAGSYAAAVAPVTVQFVGAEKQDTFTVLEGCVGVRACVGFRSDGAPAWRYESYAINS